VSSPSRHIDDTPGDQDFLQRTPVAEEDTMAHPLPSFPPVLDAVVGTARHTVNEFVRRSVEVVLPDGGQRTARRNAWIAMGEDARLARDRREAEEALAWARRRATARAAHPAEGVTAVSGTVGVPPTV
jgi:hypothetical protein